MTMKQYPKYAVLYLSIVIALIISSCGNGGEDNTQLFASAGNDVNVLVGQKVTLNGNGSSDLNGNPFDFSWEFILKPSSSNAGLEDNTTAIPSFTPDVQGKYKIELTISNTEENKDTVTVSAFKVTTIEGEYENLIPGSNVGIRDFTVALGLLIPTCEFTEIGGIQANKIACYDGMNWCTLGCGLEDGSIYDMIEYKGELYVTGQFEEIGCILASNIARWDGSNWKDVEGGLTGGDNPFGHALTIYEDELYVGGQFTKAGDVNAVNIAKWDGTEWSAVGNIESGSVRELTVYKQKLYAGGYFTEVNGINTGNIASYNGNSWTTLGSPDQLELQATGVVKHMAVLNDELYISGDFSSGNNDVSELITWNGSQFNDFGRAFSLYQNNTINELAVIDDVLYIGGSFSNVVGSFAHNLLQWDGENWGILSVGTSGPVLAIEQYDNKIFIGGDFDQAGGENAERISIWTEK